MKSSLTPYKMCLGKISYSTKKAAQEELHYWKNVASRWWESDSFSQRVYKCSFCGKYHLGNSKRR